jgi:hypothetical protein
MTRSELEEIIVEEIEAALAEIATLDEKYTSAGTVPLVHGRTMTKAQIAKRHTLGNKIFSVLKGGSGDKEDKNKLRAAFIRWAASHDRDATDEKTMNSFVWAMASDWAIKGKAFPPPKTKKKKGAASGKAEPEKTEPKKRSRKKPTDPSQTDLFAEPKGEPASTEPEKKAAPATKPSGKKATASAKKRSAAAKRGAVTKGLGKDLEKLVGMPIKTSKEKAASKKARERAAAKKASASGEKKSTKLKEIIKSIHAGES